MKGFLRVLVLTLIIIFTLISLVINIATLYNVCPIHDCDFDKIPFVLNLLYVVVIFAGTTTFVFSCWLLSVWYRRDEYVFAGGWFSVDFLFWGFPLFIFSLIMYVVPGLITIGFYVRGLPINFWGAFWGTLLLHINAGAVVQILFKPTREEVHWA